jgi:hypothetical protein
MRLNVEAKALFNQKNYILKAKRITAVETDQIKESIRLKIGEDIENHTNRVNNGKMDTCAIEHQKGNKERNSTAAGKVETNIKYPSAEAEQHTVRDRLKEDIQTTWHKMKPLQMSERKNLPKNKFIKLQEEVNAVIEELLEEEMDITDINNLIYAKATIMVQTLNEPSKKRKNRSNVKFWKIRTQKQIYNWRKELSIMAETGTGSDSGKLNSKKRKICQKYSVTNARELVQLTETLKQKKGKAV